MGAAKGCESSSIRDLLRSYTRFDINALRNLALHQDAEKNYCEFIMKYSTEHSQ